MILLHTYLFVGKKKGLDTGARAAMCVSGELQGTMRECWGYEKEGGVWCGVGVVAVVGVVCVLLLVVWLWCGYDVAVAMGVIWLLFFVLWMS